MALNSLFLYTKQGWVMVLRTQRVPCPSYEGWSQDWTTPTSSPLHERHFFLSWNQHCSNIPKFGTKYCTRIFKNFWINWEERTDHTQNGCQLHSRNGQQIRDKSGLKHQKRGMPPTVIVRREVLGKTWVACPTIDVKLNYAARMTWPVKM